MDNQRFHAYRHDLNEDPAGAYDTENRDGVYSYSKRTHQENPAHKNSVKSSKRGYSLSLSLIGLLLVAAFLLSNSGVFDGGTYFNPKNYSHESPSNHTVVAESAKNDKHMSVYSAAARNDAKAMSITDISKVGKPSVVAISTEKNINLNAYFKIPMPVSGSGFFISEDGYIATNNHIIEGANNIKVHTDSGDFYDAELVGADPYSDLAVIKVKARDNEKFPAVNFGKSADLEVGELAVAIGNPAGILEGSVTAGIISALERTIDIGGLELKVLQTDAAINSGNSGGALFNSYGEVIGVNTAKLSGGRGGSFEGISFAIPSDVAWPILEELILHGEVVSRVQLGIVGRGFGADFARLYNIADRPGVLVSEVLKDSSADKAGILPGDFIVELDGKVTDSIEAVNNMKKNWAIGDTIEVVYFRKGEKVTSEMTLEGVPTKEEVEAKETESEL